MDNTENKPKMVFVAITSLNMRKGKLAAQCGHAAIAAYKHFIENEPNHSAFVAWENGNYAKICVGIPTLEELIELQNQAKQKNIFCHLILDAGLTEFSAPTITVGVFGPAFSNEMNLITGNLKLL